MKKSELKQLIKEEIVSILSEDRKAKEYIQSIEDPEEREAEKKRMFGDDELNEVEESDLDKVKAEIAKNLEIYKNAEGEAAKKEAVEMLKKLNAEKKRLEAERDEASEKEMEATLSIGVDQELDYDSED